MISKIRRFMDRFRSQAFRILWFELLLFSVLYGVAYRSWIIFGVIFLGSYWLLNRPRGPAYMIYVMSSLWGFIAFSIGYSLGWGWAVALGLTTVFIGVMAHMSELKLSFDKPILVDDDALEWRRRGYLDLPN